VHGCSKAWCNLVLLSLFLLHWRMQYIQSMNSYSFLFLSQIMMQQRPSFDLIYGITNALLLISLPVTAKFNLNVILCTLCAKCCGTVQHMSGSILNIIYTIFFKLAFKWHSCLAHSPYCQYCMDKFCPALFVSLWKWHIHSAISIKLVANLFLLLSCAVPYS
jgi:hypothetical protein